MSEAIIISTIASSREALNKIVTHVDAKTFSDIGQILFKYILEYYSADKDTVLVDLGLLDAKLKSKLGTNYSLAHEYIEGLPAPSSLPNLLDLFASQQRETKATEIVQALSFKKDERAKKAMEEYLAISPVEEDELFNATPLDVLDNYFQGTNIIPLYPTKLNNLIHGGAPRQSQVCIIARPDVGKSTFVINLAGGAAQNNYKVLYIGNEDPTARLMYRIVSRLVGAPEAAIKKNLKKYYEEALANGYENIYFKSMHPGTLPEIRNYVEKVEPDLVIVDQIRNCDFAMSSGMTVNLEQGAIGMRNLAKEFNFVSVLVTQAGEEAHHKLILDYNDVEYSNTGVAAQMDLMVGMGQNKDFKDQGKVMLSFPKNKLCAPILPFHAKIDYETNTIRA